MFMLPFPIQLKYTGKERKGKERKGKERRGKERKGKERSMEHHD